jgi:hypothetical protein
MRVIDLSISNNYYTKSIDIFYFILLLVFNATFSNISAISWRPVLVVEEDGPPLAWVFLTDLAFL